MNYKIQQYKEEIKRYELAVRLIEEMTDLSKTVDFAPSGLFWVTVNTREDLARLMKLAPQWKKKYGTSEIEYVADVDGVEVTIKAQNEALPATCKLVQETVEVAAEMVPAQLRPAYTTTRYKIVCNEKVTGNTESE